MEENEDAPMDVTLLRLLSGENVVAQLLEEHDTHLTITYPIVIHTDNDSMGATVMWIAEWIPATMIADKNLDISKAMIMLSAEPSEKLINIYRLFLKKIRASEQSIKEAPERESQDMESEIGEDLLEILKNTKRTLH